MQWASSVFHIFIIIGLFVIDECEHAESDLSFVDSVLFHRSPKSRIIGGQKAPYEKGKYMVYISAYDYVVNQTSSCGGTLISDQFVLTAAHCLLNTDHADLLFGMHDLANDPLNIVRRCNAYDSYIFHEEADIALIKLPRKVSNKKARIEYVKLATNPNDDDYIGQNARAYGWGLSSDDPDDHGSSDLLYVDITVEKCEHCSTGMNETCTSGRGMRGTCVGDSGGPLVLQNDTQFGITSWGDSHCESTAQTVYVSVHKYLNWIKEFADIP